MAGIRKGTRNKQRRALAQCIIDAWSSLDDSGGTPRVSRKELYRRCSNIGIKLKEIGMELVTMRDAGLVVLDGDEVLCGEVPPNSSSVDDASAIPGSARRALRETSVTTLTTAAPTVGTTHGSSNSNGKKRMGDTGGLKRGLESVEGALGADRVTRSRSRTFDGGDDGNGEDPYSAGSAGAEGGPIVRRGRGSDWAAYLTREGQSARLEAWRKGCNDEEDNDMVREEDEDE